MVIIYTGCDHYKQDRAFVWVYRLWQVFWSGHDCACNESYMFVPGTVTE